MNLNDAYTVTQITHIIKRQLEVPELSRIWVVGEVVSQSRSQAGHIYFSLKDQNDTSLPCTFFANFAKALDFPIENGTKIYAFGMITVYEKRGTYQLNVMKVVPAGAGELALKLKLLKEKLQKEGLFDPELKQPVPSLPAKIGLVTSPQGAAIRDFMKMIQDIPTLSVVLFPASVQGADAPETLIRGIETLDRMDDVDVIVITRGGGSEEDLFCFNDEALARAIVACQTPVISAVGHEKDTQISDLVADLRLPTPTAAGRYFAQQYADTRAQVQKLKELLRTAMIRYRDRNPETVRFAMLSRQLQDQALRFLPEREQALDLLTRRITEGMNRQLTQNDTRLAHLKQRIHPATMLDRLTRRQERVHALTESFSRAMKTAIQDRQHRLASLANTLNAVNPLNVLKRGFTATFRKDGRQLVRSIDEITSGDSVSVRFVDGLALCHVLYTEKKEPQ